MGSNASIHVYRRKRKKKDGREVLEKHYVAQIRFTGDHTGHYLRSTGKTSEREARIEARRIAREIEEVELPEQKKQENGVLTVETMFGTWFLEAGHDLKSRKDVDWHMETLIKQLGASTEATQISNKTVHLLVQRLKDEDASAWVINRLLERLRGTMRYAIDYWEVEFERFPNFGKFMQEVPKEREIDLTYDEAAQLINSMPHHITLAAAWSYYSGCRLNETATLHRSKVFLEAGYVIVKTKSRKKDAERRIPLTAKSLPVLLEALDEPHAKDLVFNMKNRRKHFEAARKAIGREDFRWHDWRHLTASHSSRIGNAHPKLIGKTLGQTSLAATERYLHVMDKEVVELLNQLPTVYVPKQSRLSTPAIQGYPQMKPERDICEEE